MRFTILSESQAVLVTYILLSGCGNGYGSVSDASASVLVVPPPSSAVSREFQSSGCPSTMSLVEGGSLVYSHEDKRVTLAPFCLDRLEVTVRAYDACVAEGLCEAVQPSRVSAAGCNWSNRLERAEHPMNCVTYPEATAFCEAYRKRLPSAAEYEWVLQGMSRQWLYPWGDDVPSRRICWSGVEQRVGTCAVGMFSDGRSPEGVADLVGNVSEWTATRNEGVGRQGIWVAGGSYAAGPASESVLATASFWQEAGTADALIGFRCARSVW